MNALKLMRRGAGALAAPQSKAAGYFIFTYFTMACGAIPNNAASPKFSFTSPLQQNL
jgi:hypothetical protein